MAEEKAGQENAPKQDTPPVEGADPEKKEPARVYSQEEMDRITAKVRRNAARDAELRLRREAPQPQTEKKEPEPPKEDVEPKRDDFETYEDHQRELTRFEARKVAREERKKADEEARQKTVQEQQTKAQQAWAGKIERAQVKHADFEDVLEENSESLNVIGAAPMRAFITESDIGPEIIFYLAPKLDEVKRIAALPAYKQAAEIAKIEDTLVAAAKPKKEDPKEGDEPDDETPEEKEARERDDDGRFKPKKETPKADEPIEPVGARPASASAEPSDKDDAATWHRKRVAQLAKRRNPGR